MRGRPRASNCPPTNHAWSCYRSPSLRQKPFHGFSTTDSMRSRRSAPRHGAIADQLPPGPARGARAGGASPAASARGQGWLVVNGCCDGTGAHRGAILPVNGRLYDSQRFAIDFVQADAEGRLVVGDAANVRSWVGYGAIVRAAAAGRGVASRNDLSDQIPGSRP